MRSSSLPLLVKCHGSAILPGEQYDTEEAQKARDWGKAAHAWKETGNIGLPTTTVRAKSDLDRAIRTSGIHRGVYWPSDGVHELSVALRVDGTREVLLSSSPLTDEVEDNWISGTADFQSYIFDTELWIDDLKTGKIYLDDEGNNCFPQDVRSPQLSFYGVALARAANYHGPVHVSLTHWPRLPLSARHSLPTRAWVTYDEKEQESVYTALETLYNKYHQDKLSGEVHMTPGDHCRFCPSRNFCIEAKTDFPIYQSYKKEH